MFHDEPESTINSTLSQPSPGASGNNSTSISIYMPRILERVHLFHSQILPSPLTQTNEHVVCCPLYVCHVKHETNPSKPNYTGRPELKGWGLYYVRIHLSTGYISLVPLKPKPTHSSPPRSNQSFRLGQVLTLNQFMSLKNQFVPFDGASLSHRLLEGLPRGQIVLGRDTCTTLARMRVVLIRKSYDCNHEIKSNYIKKEPCSTQNKETVNRYCVCNRDEKNTSLSNLSESLKDKNSCNLNSLYIDSLITKRWLVLYIPPRFEHELCRWHAYAQSVAP